MRLLICVVTHNRLDYTKECLFSLQETLGVNPEASEDDDFSIVVVDNASDPDTVEWLNECKVTDHLILNKNNRYPGAACNQGWTRGLEDFDATHLCRIDNDCVMQPGWFARVKECFEKYESLGQLGLINMNESPEFKPRFVEHNGPRLNVGPTNIGGPNVITRKLWDQGLRYSEIPWHNFGGPTPQEDVKLSLDIRNIYGQWFANIAETICVEQSFTDTDKYYDYYQRTFSERGHGVPCRVKDGVVIESNDGTHV